jgi:ketosteroid isomerase-like protein
MSADLEARLELLEAERAITRTLHRYAQSIDYGDEEGWVDCFTEDGVFDVRSRHAHQLKRLITGRDELRAFVARHTRAPELWHKHLLIEPLIDVDGETATCVSYLLVVMEHEDVPVMRVFGRYRDRLVRGEDGRWRFRERIAEIESMRADLPPFVDGRPGRT